MEDTSFQKQDGLSRLIAVALEGPVPLLIMLIALVIVKSKQGTTRRFVRMGERGAKDLIEVVSGLSPGDIVLIATR